MEVKIKLLFMVLHVYFAYTYGQECVLESNHPKILRCEGLSELDLPLEDFSGHFDQLILENCNFTKIPSFSFENIMPEKMIIQSNDNLEEIEAKFMGTNPRWIHELIIKSNYDLYEFPFWYLEQFGQLQQFALTESAIENVPSDISWPNSLHKIDLSWNSELYTIQSHAFSRAPSLMELSLTGSGNNLLIESNGLHVKSKLNKTLYLSGNFLDLGANAFGNVDGGELWNHLYLETSDFPEEVFRLFLKSHFDKNSMVSGLFHPSDTYRTRVDDCSTCDIAWLYHDAHRFGIYNYQKLVGENNVVCPGGQIGAVLESTDPDFIKLMQDCPHTPMPWPGPNVCDGETNPNQNDAPDPENCKCFYKCDAGEIHGHECCPPGLVFNPDILVCDWPYNVPDCHIR